MHLHKNTYYNIRVSCYEIDNGEFVEVRWKVSVDSLSDWLHSIDLNRFEVLIRDIETIQFDSVITPPRWFKYGD